MSLLHGWWHRLHVLARGERYARELDAEQRFHRELEAMSRTSEGRVPHDAEMEARRAFGNATYYREEARRMTPLGWLDHLRQDAAYAWRGLRRSPGFTVTVVMTLGLGLGVNAAMFSLIDRLFVRAPSGVAAPRDVRRLYMSVARPTEPTGRLSSDNFKYPHFRAIAATADSGFRVAAFTYPDSTAITSGDMRVAVRRSYVTGGYFDLLGVRPQHGRFFTGEELLIETPTPTVVLSDAFWRRQYEGDPTTVGRIIFIDFRPYIVVGVAPRDFTGADLDAADMWTPANTYAGSPGADPWYTTYRNSFRVVARIPAGVVEEQLLTTASQAVRSVHMKRYAYDSTALVLSGPIVRSLGPARRAQEVTIATRLAGVALIVLLITCANVANLLLVRATRRRREIAVRRVLGVSAGRLYEQLLTESVLLAALGGAAALLFALWAATALRRLLLPGVQWSGGAVDLRTVLFAGIAALIVGVAAGLAPALNATQPDLTTALKSGREGGFRRSRLQSALLIAQAGLSVILLVGAGLFVTSLRNVRAIELGYDVERSLFIRPMFGATPPSATEIGAGLTQVGARLSSAPGVEAVGFASSLPMQGYSAMPIFLPDRDSLPALGDERGASFNSVSPGFLPAVGVQLIAGRNFNEGDREGSLGAVIVSRAMAHAFWPGQPAVGKCLILEKRANPCSIVVGVAEDVNRLIVIEKASMQYYLPLAQYPSVPADVAIRTNPENMAAVRALAGAELKRAFPSMTTPFIRVMRGSLESQYRPWRLGALLFTAFGALALLVAAIGVYSVVSYAVSQRVHEMGVRIALGAGVADILRLVARESITTVGLGVALGIVAALGLGRLVASLLYGISERDPVVLAASALVLCLVGVAASLVPAWRAARVDPVTALRAD